MFRRKPALDLIRVDTPLPFYANPPAIRTPLSPCGGAWLRENAMRKTLMVAAVSATFAMTANVWAAERKTGTIVSLDNATKTFVCRWGGEDRTYKTTDKTVFRAGTKN